jgi:hypothetical protein
MNSFARFAGLFVLLAACTSTGQTTAPSAPIVAQSSSVNPPEPTTTLPGLDGFCELARQAVDGAVALALRDQADRLTEFPGLSGRQRSMMRPLSPTPCPKSMVVPATTTPFSSSL